MSEQNLAIKKQLTVLCERVKCVDLHPTHPWLALALYNGRVQVWNHQQQEQIKTLEVCEKPVRAVRFIDRKNWMVTGSDDKKVRVFDVNTWDLLHEFEAHSDFIRSIAVHPSLPCLLTSGDDHMVKQWDWEKGWTCTQQYEGHGHYVMQVAFSQHDPTLFASASLDKTIKIWKLGSESALYTLEGHEKGVNCLCFYDEGGKHCLLSGSDDCSVRIWDVESRVCIGTLDGHSHNVSDVICCPVSSLLLSTSEDGTVRLYDRDTRTLRAVLSYDMGRVWTLACGQTDRLLVLGCDDGAIVVRVMEKN